MHDTAFRGYRPSSGQGRLRLLLDMVRHALDAMRRTFEQEQLRQLAELYAELYDDDAESQEWIEAAIQRWPE